MLLLFPKLFVILYLAENHRSSAGKIDLKAVSAIFALSCLIGLMVDPAVAAVAEIVCTHHYLIPARAGDADEIAIKGFGAVEIKGENCATFFINNDLVILVEL